MTCYATLISPCTWPSTTARDVSRCTGPTCTPRQSIAWRRPRTSRSGLEANQFEVFYQPIVDTHTGPLLGAEALVRWRHPSRGVIAPIEFIPIAEATGLIVPLGRQVLRDATRQAQIWRQSGVVDEQFYVSVNVSAVQLQEPDPRRRSVPGA